MSIIDNDLYLSDEHRIYRIPELNSGIEKAQILFKTNTNRNMSENKQFYEFKTRVLNVPTIYGFKLGNRRSFLNEKNNCHNSNCSHLCLPTGHAFRCVCPIGYKLRDNNICKIIFKEKSYQKIKRRSNKYPIINSLFIALLFVLILLFYVRYLLEKRCFTIFSHFIDSYKLSRTEQDQNTGPDKSKRVSLRLIMKRRPR